MRLKIQCLPNSQQWLEHCSECDNKLYFFTILIKATCSILYLLYVWKNLVLYLNFSMQVGANWISNYLQHLFQAFQMHITNVGQDKANAEPVLLLRFKLLYICQRYIFLIMVNPSSSITPCNNSKAYLERVNHKMSLRHW